MSFEVSETSSLNGSQKKTQLPIDILQTILIADFGNNQMTKYLAKKFNIETSTIILVYLVFFLFGIYYISQFQLVFVAIAVLHPLVKTIRTLEAKDDPQMKIWTSYWVIIGFWLVFEPILGIVLVEAIPFYDTVKLILLVWLQKDNAFGSKLLYERIIKHAFNNQLNAQAKLDDIIDKLTNRNF